MYEETQRSITASTLRKIIKNEKNDFQTKEKNSYRGKMAIKVDGKLFQQNVCANFKDKSTVLDY